MANEIIKETAKSRGVKLWEIAEKLGINDGNFSRILRRDLSPDQTSRVLTIIDELSSHAQKSRFSLIREMPIKTLAEYMSQTLADGMPVDWYAWLTEDVEI